jgi:uncharacterized protein (DUF305 family)
MAIRIRSRLAHGRAARTTWRSLASGASGALGASGKTIGALAAVAVMASVLAEPAAAGHGSVSYENQLKAEQKKKQAEQAEQEQNQAAPPVRPASTAPAVATPAGAMPVAGSEANRERAFAATTRQQLSDSVRAAEDEIANGTDPQLQAIARNVVESHRKQIAELDKWLAAHPPAK